MELGAASGAAFESGSGAVSEVVIVTEGEGGAGVLAVVGRSADHVLPGRHSTIKIISQFSAED